MLHHWFLVKEDIDPHNDDYDPEKNGEVIGILELNILELNNPDLSDLIKDIRKINVIVKMDQKFGPEWTWFRISQAEFETYRDLHEFDVIELAE